MKRLILAVLSFIALTAEAVPLACHATPAADDRAFYDLAVVSVATQMTWGGQAANQFAGSTIYRRRQAFYGLAYAIAGAPLDAEEIALWDALVVAALQRGAYATSGNAGPWLDIGTASEWAHGIAWDATYYRMTTKCP